jgi:hypothetical protein
MRMDTHSYPEKYKDLWNPNWNFGPNQITSSQRQSFMINGAYALFLMCK